MEQHNRHGTDEEAASFNHQDDDGGDTNLNHQAKNDATLKPSKVNSKTGDYQGANDSSISQGTGLRISFR